MLQQWSCTIYFPHFLQILDQLFCLSVPMVPFFLFFPLLSSPFSLSLGSLFLIIPSALHSLPHFLIFHLLGPHDFKAVLTLNWKITMRGLAWLVILIQFRLLKLSILFPLYFLWSIIPLVNHFATVSFLFDSSRRLGC